jgi:hypothetical protein
MLLNFCSKLIKSFIGNINVKITDNAAEDADMFESATSSEPETDEDVHPVKEPPVEITIKNPKYEFAHGSKFKSDQPHWIVVHYTACAGASAEKMCKSMKDVTKASSHFYVDSKDICASVPLKYVAWHVCGGKVQQPYKDKTLTLEELSKFKADNWRYDLAAKNHLKWISEGEDFLGNYYSIGVDFCVLKKSKKTKDATDTDWYFNPVTVENVAKLVAYLANVYKIDDSHIIRHCDATGKLCPRPLVSILPNEDNDSKWEDFKAKVSEYRKRGIIAKWV